MTLRPRVAALLVVVAVVSAGGCRDREGRITLRPPERPTTSTSVAAARAPDVEGAVVVATADVVCSARQAAANGCGAAECRSEETAAVARDLSPEAVLLAGDVQYDRGTEQEYATFARSAWSSFGSKLHAAAGNHEYATPGAAPFFARFPAARGPERRGYYSFDVGGWHIVALNSNCRPAGGCEAGSPQERWLRADLAANAARCTLAFWHHPRWSSGFHGSDASMEPLWAALAAGGADVAVSGHDHHYERFAPERGVRQFVVGTGGRSLYPVLGTERGSEVRNSNTFGVLELRLGDGEYGWVFHGVPGTSFTDAGEDRCR